MKKKLTAMLLTAAMLLLTGCVSDQVQMEDPDSQQKPAVAEPEEPAKDAVKTGLSAIVDREGSQNAGETGGSVQYDLVLAAVTVDEAGVITDCVLDGIHTSLEMDQTGAITSDLALPLQTRTEQADSDDWKTQASSLAEQAVGKTVEDLRNWTTEQAEAGLDASETQRTPDTENSDDQTAEQPDESPEAESMGDVFRMDAGVTAIEQAVRNATHLGASAEDTLALAAAGNWDSGTDAVHETDGMAQLNVTMTAVTKRDGVITSCVLDGVQTAVQFDQTGRVTTDLEGEIRTKNELGEAYGMKESAGSAYEWNEQAAFFADYVTGKTAEEVGDIAVAESGAPAGEDLASTVTIQVGAFRDLIERAAR